MIEAKAREANVVRSALFVDFDNIYLGLRKLDEKAAEAFANTPARWLSWLEEGMDSGRGVPRRFLIRNVYLNPVTFGSYRGVYTRTGFRAVDCPPLTGQGKNSADIYMVLDIVDALASNCHYDEFVIASADADFTPILHRLRGQDRRTTLLTAGLSATAYRAVCDSFVPPEVLADAALGQADVLGDDDVALSLMVQPSAEARKAATRPGLLRTEQDIDSVRAAIRRAVAAADKPIASATAAHAALKAAPGIKRSQWWGAGSFRAFIALYLEDLTYEGTPSPGFVFDPSRHSRADLPFAERVELDPLLQRISVVTGAPAITNERYAALFLTLAEDLATAPFDRKETSKRVRDRTAEEGKSAGGNAVNFVIQGLVFSGFQLVATVSAQEIAEAYLANLKSLCVNARMTMSANDEEKLRNWITGALPDDS